MNEAWVIAADVDLGKASMSPRAKLMPIVSVPFLPADGTLPKIKVPAADPSNRNAVEFSLAKPWDVGNAARFTRSAKSFMAVPLQSDYKGNTAVPGFSSDVTQADCKFGTKDSKSLPSASPSVA